MSDHERKTLREAIVSQLKGETPFRTVAGERVYETRLGPVRDHELPAITVYVDEETVDPASITSAPRYMSRTATIAIEGWVKSAADVDDALDAFALQIETAMDVDLNFNGAAINSVMSGTEFGLKIDGNRPMGCVRMLYAVTYETTQRIEAPEDAFDSIDIHYDLAGEQEPDDQAEDVVTGINQE